MVFRERKKRFITLNDIISFFTMYDFNLIITGCDEGGAVIPDQLKAGLYVSPFKSIGLPYQASEPPVW